MPVLDLSLHSLGILIHSTFIRSTTSMDDIQNLPTALVTGLSTMYYVDTDIVKNQKYYYRVVVWRDGINQ
jgi:hypothetical protein